MRTWSNLALHRTANCASGLPWGFCFICQFVAVGELGRSAASDHAQEPAITKQRRRDCFAAHDTNSRRSEFRALDSAAAHIARAHCSEPIAMAAITAKVLGMGYEPRGSTQGDGGRVFTFTP